jgi:hypothetical protein
MRGRITEEIKQKSKELLGYEISQQELRLMPYIQYVMTNQQMIDPNKISLEERIVLSAWRERGFIEGGASGLSITKEFWNALCEILWLGYVDYEQ